MHFADPKGKFVNCLIAGAVNTAVYYGVNKLTDQKVTFAGAAKAFVSGAVGGCFGPILGTLAGELTKVVIENVIQDKPFDINEVRDDLISDVGGNLWPGGKNAGRVRNIFDRLMGWLIDPTKSCDEKLSMAKAAFSKIGISIKLEHCSDIPKIGDKIIHWIRSHDPNDIIGPTGYGAAHFIPKGLKMDFKIRFENDENATAPAQRVTVEYKIDENIDMRTFRLGSFGFGNYVYEIKDTASSVQVKVNLTQTYGVFVRVKGGLDIVNKKATWEFQTIDPNTGMAPDDPRRGFLPPNNGTSGQGFVTFSVYPKKGAYTLARINVQGTIYFDQNQPIDTPLLFYTIDNTPPNINCTVVKEMLQSEILAVNLEATDKGSGFSFTDIFLKRESGYEMILTGASSTIITLPLLPGETYELLFIPVDFTGNRPTIQNVDSSNLLKIDFPKVKGSCDHLNNCSENGNCTSNNICVCNSGFFGTDCSLDTAPLEPPILETRDVVGWEDSPIPLFLFAKVLNGTVYDTFKIIIRNYPANSKFTTGTESGNHWEINSMELENISFIPPSDTSGNFQLEITGLLEYGVLNASRTNVVNLIIKPVIDGVDIDIQTGCFDIKRGAAFIKLNMNQKDSDFSERVKLMIELPEQYTIRNSNKTNDGMYRIENPNITSIFEVRRLNNYSVEFVPINVTLFFVVSKIGTSNITSYNRSEIIRQCQRKGILRPPLIQSVNGYGIEDTPIHVFIEARTPNNTYTFFDTMYILLFGYPTNSSFSRGTPEEDHWRISQTDFGNISYVPPRDFSGNFTLNITAYGLSNKQTLISYESMDIIVYPVIDGVIIQVDTGCYKSSSQSVSVNISIDFLDSDGSERANFSIRIPPSFTLLNRVSVSHDTYRLNKTEIEEGLNLQYEGQSSPNYYAMDLHVQADVWEMDSDKIAHISNATHIYVCSAPPMITCISGSGNEDMPILLFIDAISPNYTLQSFKSIVIVLDGYPINSSFSQGKQEDKQWRLSEQDFGNISYIPPRDFSGNFSLNILAYGLSDKKNLTSVATIDITINPVIDGVNIKVAVGCYKSASENISVNIAMTDLDSDGSETGSYIVQVPPSFMLNQGVSISRDTYKLTKNEIGGSLNLHYLDKYPPVSSEMTLTVTGEIWEKNFENKPQVYKEQSNIRFCIEKQQYSVNITMRINLTLTGDLNNKSYYKKVYRDTEKALTQYYFNASQIKDVFLRIILYSIRNGSLIADHSVLTSEEAEQKVQNVLNELTVQKRKLQIAGQDVEVLQANIEGSMSNPTSHGLTKLQRLSIIISCSVVAFLVFLCVVLLIRKRRGPNRKTKEQECHPGESLKLVETSHQHDTGPKQLIEMTVKPFKIPNENYGFMHS